MTSRRRQDAFWALRGRRSAGKPEEEALSRGNDAVTLTTSEVLQVCPLGADRRARGAEASFCTRQREQTPIFLFAQICSFSFSLMSFFLLLLLIQPWQHFAGQGQGPSRCFSAGGGTAAENIPSQGQPFQGWLEHLVTYLKRFEVNEVERHKERE